MEDASREILWNVSSLPNVILFYLAFFISAAIALIGLARHAELLATGKPSPEHTGSFIKRTLSLFSLGLFQRKVVKQRTIGPAHLLIYFGFLILFFTTTMVFIDHDLGWHIYHGRFYLAVTVLSDLFGLGVIVGCAIAAHRRWIVRPDLLHNASADLYLLVMLAVLCLQGFLLEGLRIHATSDEWGSYSFVGNVVAGFFWALSVPATRLLHFALWWVHSLTVFAFIALIPYSKFFHIIASSANVFFRPRKRPKGQIQSPGDLEKLMEGEEEFQLGLGTLKDYSWKHLLDLEACTSCGRCQDACPAYLSGKPLSPKWMVLDSRNHALLLHADGKLNEGSLLPDSAVRFDSGLTKHYVRATTSIQTTEEGYHANGPGRASNVLVQDAVRTLGRSLDDRIAGDVMDQNVFWSCTTCMACVEACPVGINHVDLIVGNRQNMALMHGEIPTEAAATLRSLETRANPYGAPEDRVKWIEDLDVRILQPGDSVDYLYWVGCVSAYDPRKQKIARSLVRLMKEAGLSFGILGTAEGCTGDPARRLGEENLFQTLAKSNIETLRGIQFHTLVANCPHCFNTIKNEYPEFGNLGDGKQPEIIHHSVLLKRLVAEGKLVVRDGDDEITFHDPCYLGRYNDEYDAPRDVLKSNSRLKIVEMERSREKGLCCGAGGGHFWMDLKIGERVNVLRVDEAAATGARKVATACPFCMQMMEDGTKLTNREDSLAVLDVAEVLEGQLVSRDDTPNS